MSTSPVTARMPGSGWALLGRACSSSAGISPLRKAKRNVRALAERMQDVTHDLVSYVPMGQAFPSVGLASDLTGYIDSPVPFFWNLRRED